MGTIHTLNPEEFTFKTRLKELGVIIPDGKLILTPEHAVVKCGDGNHALDMARQLELRQTEADREGRSFFRFSGPGFPLMFHPENPINRRVQVSGFMRYMLGIIINDLGYTRIVLKHHWGCGMAKKHRMTLPQSMDWVLQGHVYIAETFPEVKEVVSLMHFCLPGENGEKGPPRKSYQIVEEVWRRNRQELLSV